MSILNSVILRPMKEADLNKVLSWRNRDKVRNNMYTNHIISWQEHRIWWESNYSNPKVRLLIAVYESRDVGVVNFTNYTGVEGVATWAFYSGDYSIKGLGSMMEVAALDYAFSELQVRKLECEVLEFNMPVVNLHLRYGFRIEGIFRQSYHREGRYYDIYRLAIFADDWNKFVVPMIRSSEGVRFSMAGKSFIKQTNISVSMVEAFTQSTGDRNPVHYDDNYAKMIGVKGRIVHSMLAASMFSEFFATEFPGHGTIYLSQNVDFVRPIFVDAPIELRIKVLSHVGRRMTLETLAYSEEALCLKGRAEVLAPETILL